MLRGDPLRRTCRSSIVCSRLSMPAWRSLSTAMQSCSTVSDLMPIPGHTPGMIAMRVSQHGEEAIFAGDVAHQPLQVAFPDWSTVYCADQKQAAMSRRAMWRFYCAEAELVCCCRFILAGPIAGASHAGAMTSCFFRTIANPDSNKRLRPLGGGQSPMALNRLFTLGNGVCG